MKTLRQIVALIGTLLATGVLSTIGIVCAFPLWRGKRRAVTFWCIRTWAKTVNWLYGVKVTVIYPKGTVIDFSEPMILASNHLSSLDITALHEVLPNAFWVVKRRLFKAWFLGWIIRAVGYIGVRRDGQDHDVIRKLATIRPLLEKVECSLLFFPEGHRSRDGELQQFQKGAVRTAIENQLYILPIAISGTYELMGPGNLVRPHAGEVTVTIGRPIQPVGSAGTLNRTLRETIKQMLQDQRVRTQTHLRAVK